ncbi:hypothetical protein ACFS7Z_00300 [Pontibacter toksunensis]|uniref:Uncharacterized protein n=1 Tax=Pontibacter toksunensis TaxID=1332631 RepID=A0ABW6BLM4_9BACT
MKKLKLLLLLMACTALSYGQKVEFAGQLNTGVAKFGGESAARTTVIDYYTLDNSWNRIGNPFGKRFALSYGASLQVQRVTGNNFVIGAQAGAEVLRNRISIDKVYVQDAVYSSYIELKEVSGKSVVKNSFINVHPYLGYRKSIGAVDFDVNVGPDIGFGLSSSEKAVAMTDDGTEYTIDKERTKPETDVRARLGLAAYYRQFGISTS